MPDNPALIDNIFINTLNKNAIGGNHTSKISDHMANFRILSKTIEKIRPLHSVIPPRISGGVRGLENR